MPSEGLDDPGGQLPSQRQLEIGSANPDSQERAIRAYLLDPRAGNAVGVHAVAATGPLGVHGVREDDELAGREHNSCVRGFAPPRHGQGPGDRGDRIVVVQARRTRGEESSPFVRKSGVRHRSGQVQRGAA